MGTLPQDHIARWQSGTGSSPPVAFPQTKTGSLWEAPGWRTVLRTNLVLANLFQRVKQVLSGSLLTE